MHVFSLSRSPVLVSNTIILSAICLMPFWRANVDSILPLTFSNAAAERGKRFLTEFRSAARGDLTINVLSDAVQDFFRVLRC
jgi:hypothetical protein